MRFPSNRNHFLLHNLKRRYLLRSECCLSISFSLCHTFRSWQNCMVIDLQIILNTVRFLMNKILLPKKQQSSWAYSIRTPEQTQHTLSPIYRALKEARTHGNTPKTVNPVVMEICNGLSSAVFVISGAEIFKTFKEKQSKLVSHLQKTFHFMLP